jgi:hypothetical protein
MMYPETLANCLYALRAETGNSLSVSQGQNVIDTYRYLLKRTQIELWTSYWWPTLRIRGGVAMVPGQYIYDYPSGFSFDQVREAWAGASTSIAPIAYGIGEDLIGTGGVNYQSGDPPQAWMAEGEQFRVWPTPLSANVYGVRFIGMQAVTPWASDDILSTLDGTAIILFTAAEILARAKAEDAGIKLKKAQTYLNSLLGNAVSAKRKVSTFGAFAQMRAPTPGLDYIPMSN